MILPSKKIFPEVGSNNPDKISTIVDFPDPEGPKIPIISFLFIVKFKFSKIIFSFLFLYANEISLSSIHSLNL